MLRRINYFVLGLIGASLISAITVPFLAWFYSPDSIGRFSFFLLTVSFSVQIGALGLDQGYVREYHASQNKTRLLSESIAPIFFIVLAFFFSSLAFSLFDDLAEFIVSESTALLGVFIFLAYALSIAHRFATVYYRVKSLGALFCFTLISVKLIFLLSAYSAHMLDWRESISLYSSYLISLAVPLFGLATVWSIRLIKAPSVTFVDRSWFSVVNLDLLKYSFPLLFGALAFWGVKFSGHIGLRYYENFEELAFYSVGVSIAAGLGLFSSIFNTMWFPFLFKAEAAGKSQKALRVGIDMTLGFLIFGAGAAGVVAIFVVKLLPGSFSKVQFFLPLLVLSSLLYTLSEVSGSGIALSKQTRFGLYAGVAGSAAAIASALLLCGVYGAAGAAYSYALGHLAFFVCRTEFARRLWMGENVLRMYLVVAVCSFYTGLCAFPAMEESVLPAVVGVALMIIAIPLMVKSAVRLKSLRTELP